MRLLLKVLAVSDIVVYRTRSERLHRDLFTFIGAASRAYSHHFQTALQAVGQREGILGSLSALGPSVIVFHETRHTRILSNSKCEVLWSGGVQNPYILSHFLRRWDGKCRGHPEVTLRSDALGNRSVQFYQIRRSTDPRSTHRLSATEKSHSKRTGQYDRSFS